MTPPVQNAGGVTFFRLGVWDFPPISCAPMLRIRAFQGLSPAPQHAAEVACVPYDVVNREEAAALAEGRPHSLLHVDRAEIDLPPETNAYSPKVYTRARENLLRLQIDGALLREAQPCVYLYQQRMGSHTQTGLACVCH